MTGESAVPGLRLPADLLVDTSDRARSGIRITLNRPLARQLSFLPPAVTCAPGVTEACAIRGLEYAIVDVETTGGSWSRGHRVTEIAAQRLRGDGTVVDECRSLVNPDRPIPPFITALTNITWDMVRDAPRFAEVAPEVSRVLEGAVFVAHNAAFDWRFVSAELERAGVPLSGTSLCTVRLARRVVPELTSRSLDSLTYFFNIAVEQRHRAWGDVVATAEVFRRLMDRLDDMQVERWGELDALLRRRAKRKKRTATPHSMDEA
ncbi:MAG TPA: 3'-5' exonuclease [Longimicrobiales bacterium]|nr:3'-5' exonuclease [Longimicrobiales bacterium]